MIELRAIVWAKADVNTVKDLRELVAWLDEHSVDNDIKVEHDFKKIFIDLVPDTEAAWIEDGDSLDTRYDVLVPMRKP